MVLQGKGWIRICRALIVKANNSKDPAEQLKLCQLAQMLGQLWWRDRGVEWFEKPKDQ